MRRPLLLPDAKDLTRRLVTRLQLERNGEVTRKPERERRQGCPDHKALGPGVELPLLVFLGRSIGDRVEGGLFWSVLSVLQLKDLEQFGVQVLMPLRDDVDNDHCDGLL